MIGLVIVPIFIIAIILVKILAKSTHLFFSNIIHLDAALIGISTTGMTWLSYHWHPIFAIFAGFAAVSFTYFCSQFKVLFWILTIYMSLMWASLGAWIAIITRLGWIWAIIFSLGVFALSIRLHLSSRQKITAEAEALTTQTRTNPQSQQATFSYFHEGGNR